MQKEIESLTNQLASALLRRGQRICTAESCTGGLIAKTFTDLAGSSDWFDRGFVTYSNQSKVDMLGVEPETLDQFGAVSGETVYAMAQGAINNSQAQIAVSVSGVAGPGGGSADKPVGMVWFGFADGEQVQTRVQQFDGDRRQVREQSLKFALQQLCNMI